MKYGVEDMILADYEEFLNQGSCGGKFCSGCKFADCCDELQQLTSELSDKLSNIGFDNGATIEK